MLRTALLLAVVVLVSPFRSTSALEAPPTGTWRAERSYSTGPGIAQIVLERSAEGWVARVAGRRSQTADSSAPMFGFVGGSRLRLHLGQPLTGEWIQPGNPDNTAPIATPVVFRAVRPGRWVGIVRPIADDQHLTLIIARAAGGLEAFIHNPEENVGAQLGVRRVSIAGSVLRLQRPRSADIVGVRSADGATITLQSPGLPGAFVFRRAPSILPAHRYSYRHPALSADGWSTATLASVGIDTVSIERIVNGIVATRPGLRSPDLQSFLIARHGKLVLDAYFDGYDADRPHDVRSAGKSVTALLVGRAIADTHAFEPGTRVGSILRRYQPFANNDSRKEAITVGNLLSMSAGYACDDNDDASPGNEERMQTQTAQPDWYKYTLDLPMAFSPGTSAKYCSAEINLLGAVISAATNWWLPEALLDRFALPMQFGSYGLWLSSVPPDTAYMAGGDMFRPRDFLKFGQLFLSGGRWHGKQLVDPSWLAFSSAKHSFIPDAGGDYGYGWHLLSYKINGRIVKAINAGGNGGQLLFIFPQLDMTIMLTAGNYGQYPIWARFQRDLVPAVLRAVRDTKRFR